MTKAIAFVVIYENGELKDHDERLYDETLEELVGGKFEALQPLDKDITMFVNKDGRAKGLNPNWIATQLVKSILRPDVFIAGPAAVTGAPDGEGDVGPLPERERTRILDLVEEGAASKRTPAS